MQFPELPTFTDQNQYSWSQKSVFSVEKCEVFFYSLYSLFIYWKMLSGILANLPIAIIAANLMLSFHHHQFDQLCIKSYSPPSQFVIFKQFVTCKIDRTWAILTLERLQWAPPSWILIGGLVCMHWMQGNKATTCHAFIVATALLEGECVRMRKE